MQKETTAILDIAYPNVKECLDNKTNINRWKQYMSKFIQKRQKELYSTMPSKQMYYSAEDVNEWYKATGIDKKTINNAIKQTYYAKMANFNPSYAKDDSTIALLCMVKYFKDNKMNNELILSLINISFSGKFYPSVFYKSFRFEPAEYVMDYVVNHMLSNKFDLIKAGNVIGAVRSVSETWINSYSDRFKDFTDEDCTYLVQQLHNRIDSFIHNIAVLYYKAYEDKDYITYDNDDVSEDNYHLADNDSFRLERASQNAIDEITHKGVDYTNCKRSSNDAIKFDELKSILESIFDKQENLPLVREYITLLIALYFQNNISKDVRDLSFISYSIKVTPNSKNKYVLRKKELLDLILLNNSEQFARRRSRAATESAYYRAINAYFALTIQKANK